jgi:hypothetical protein
VEVDAELEAAARDDVPERFSRVRGVSLSPWGEYAVVLLETNEPPYIELEQVVCRREPSGGWVALMSGGGVSDVVYVDDVRARLITNDDPLPADVTAVAVRDRGAEREVPVRDRYFVYGSWKRDVPGDNTTDPLTPEIVGLIRGAN